MKLGTGSMAFARVNSVWKGTTSRELMEGGTGAVDDVQAGQLLGDVESKGTTQICGCRQWRRVEGCGLKFQPRQVLREIRKTYKFDVKIKNIARLGIVLWGCLNFFLCFC